MPPRSFMPVSGMEMPRFSGIPTFMRLPHVLPDDPDIDQVDIGLIGIPWDAGTTNRPGARHGPRQLRDLSTMIRLVHPVSKVNPFALCNCADLGDVRVNPTDVEGTLTRITDAYAPLIAKGIVPLTAGGDHLTSLPVLRAVAAEGPVGMIHFDSHTDLNDSYFDGDRFTHGTPFRRAIEEGLLDPARVVQIGIRGAAYDAGSDLDWGRAQGVTIIEIEEYFERGPRDVMAQAREIAGDGPTYVSFDIDVVDPAYAPGTGTPEIGGPTAHEAQLLVRGLAGLNLVGADLVEVSPPFDPSGGTAWVGASLMFELLCVLAPAKVARGDTRA